MSEPAVLSIYRRTASVPHADRLIETRRHDEVVAWVELRAHDVVVVACQHREARARLPVPEANRLVVRRAHEPRLLVVELHGADVVEVAQQRKETAAQLVVPAAGRRGREGGGGRRAVGAVRSLLAGRPRGAQSTHTLIL